MVLAGQRAKGIDGRQDFIGAAAPAVDVDSLNKISRVGRVLGE